jgi:hypothetical protein
MIVIVVHHLIQKTTMVQRRPEIPFGRIQECMEIEEEEEEEGEATAGMVQGQDDLMVLMVLGLDNIHSTQGDEWDLTNAKVFDTNSTRLMLYLFFS